MKKVYLLCLVLCICMWANAQATDLVIDCQTPGWLSSKINYSDQQTVRNLKVTGNINADDLKFIGRLIGQESLNGHVDLSDANVVGNKMKGNVFSIHGKSIQRLDIPKSIKELSQCLYDSNGYLSVDTLVFEPTNIKYVGAKFFDKVQYGNAIKNLIVGENIDSIPNTYDGFWEYKSLKSILFKGKLRYVGDHAFAASDSLSKINMEALDSVEYLGTYAFTLPLDKFYIPKKLKWIYPTIFTYTKDAHIYFHSEFNEIRKKTTYTEDFGNSGKLNFHFKTSIPPESAISFGSINYTVYVPKGTETAYRNVYNFKNATIIEENPITSIKLEKHKITLNIGEEETLNITINPEDADDQRISWNSSNTNVVAVDKNGNITAMLPGVAKIYAVSVATGIKDSCLVTVRKNVETINFTDNQIVLDNIGNSKKLEYNITPDDATDKSVTWNSSNEQVCTVSSTGLVTAVGPGTAVVTVTTVDGGHTASCTVKVLQHVTSVTLEKHTSTLNVGEQELMRASILPENADDKTVKWTSSDNTIASVDANGNVTALKPGETWIKVISNDNTLEKDSCKLTVIQPVTGISLSKENMTLNNIGDNDQLTATIMPADASNKEVRWSSSNDNVCIVNNGLVTAVGAGTSSVTATTVDGSFTATCIVKVTQHVSDIELNKSSLSLKVGESEKLQATVLPQNAENKMVTWTSSDSRIAIVNANGNVAAIKAGEAWIKAVSADNPLAKDSCKLTVVQPVTNIKITPETYRLTNIGENIQLETTVLPEDATNKDVKWSSTNESVCVVANGKVIATGYGTAVVLATTTDGGHTASCAIVVEKETIPVTSINLSQKTANIYKGETLLLTAEITPQNATNKNLIWKSSNESICIVSQSGLLVGLNEGSAIITVVPENGIGQAQCVVSVEERVNAITNSNETTGDNVAIYDLMGQKVTHLIKGRIYICKGKKFVAR